MFLNLPNALCESNTAQNFPVIDPRLTAELREYGRSRSTRASNNQKIANKPSPILGFFITSIVATQADPWVLTSSDNPALGKQHLLQKDALRRTAKGYLTVLAGTIP
ncbi:hypothetical protein LSUCC0031_04900 [Rhodobacterales bacterium LSUCC0031]|nr:hypothetical protein [Rhodobacterales bacterium LSUCC0031]